MKSVTVNTTLLKSITVLPKTDFTPMGHNQLKVIQITYHPKHGLKQVLSNVTTLFTTFQFARFGLIFQIDISLLSFLIQC